MNGFESALSLSGEILRLATTVPGLGIEVCILGIVFAWSGIAKLRRPTRAAMAIVDFGVLRRVRPALGSVLGGAELALALALVTGLLPIVFLPLAATLLWVFVVLIARSLRDGERFECFCFGGAGSKLSGLTLLRTGALALLASTVAISAPTSGVFADFGIPYALQAVSAAALVGGLVLAGQIPKLLRWNKDPYRIGNVEDLA
jgi:hypothetical protein